MLTAVVLGADRAIAAVLEILRIHAPPGAGADAAYVALEFSAGRALGRGLRVAVAVAAGVAGGAHYRRRALGILPRHTAPRSELALAEPGVAIGARRGFHGARHRFDISPA